MPCPHVSPVERELYKTKMRILNIWALVLVEKLQVFPEGCWKRDIRSKRRQKSTINGRWQPGP